MPMRVPGKRQKGQKGQKGRKGHKFEDPEPGTLIG